MSECIREALSKATRTKTSRAIDLGGSPLATMTKDDPIHHQEGMPLTEHVNQGKASTLNRFQQIIAARQQRQHSPELER